LCANEDVTYQFNGTYEYLTAMVGVADGADPADQNTSVDFTVLDSSDNEIGSQKAQYHHAVPISVPIRNLTSITLSTDGNGPCFSGNSAAVWADLRLVP
jgi:hypothetical protein